MPKTDPRIDACIRKAQPFAPDPDTYPRSEPDNTPGSRRREARRTPAATNEDLMTRLKLSLGLFALIAATLVVATLTETSSRAAQAPAALRATGRALTIEDYYRIKTVGAPQMSPNGRWVLFTVTTRVEETNGSTSASYVVPTDASAKQRQIQHEGKDVTGASWTADSLLRYTANGQSFQIDPAAQS